MRTENIVRLAPERDEKAYFREVLISLAKEEKTPSDIFDAAFGEVQVEEKEYLMLSGQAHIEYTCSVGYDRQEEYYEQVRKYDSSTKSYYYANERKTRTVTDWHPYSGSATSKEVYALGNDDSQEGYRSSTAALICFTSTKRENMEDLNEPATVNATAYAEAKRACLASCWVHTSTPGDHVKDSHYEGDVDVETVGLMRATEYTLSYEYNGTQYNTTGFASGDLQMQRDFPNASDDVRKEARKSVAHFKYMAIGFLAVGVILNILMAWIGWWCVIGYGLAIASLVLYIVQGNKREKEIYKIRQEEKKKSLIAILQRFELEPLSLEEIEGGATA